ncbi:MAG: nickel pincer cofactor biosynthesis protein LarB [Methanobacteriaceae archaeon]|nr:nickel pincer cofactor biosynthesis protein LarB [Candidatus Methanorudis spinitermitis]
MRKILENLLNGEININEAENLLKSDNIMELDEIAKFDIFRKFRTGFPEAILAQGKKYNDLSKIIRRYFDKNVNKVSQDSNVLITRLEKEMYIRLKDDLSYLSKECDFKYNSKAKILKISKKNHNNINEGSDFENVNNINLKNEETHGKIGIITAGTSDIAAAEEAKVIVEEGGCEALTSYDVGVAGIHRLFPQIAKMIEENVCAIIVCAGMEGALPSVVAGLVDIPVIGVPTSVGYGIGGKGEAALYAMLQSCAPGIAVVNIDNGFGAGVFALTIAKNTR